MVDGAPSRNACRCLQHLEVCQLLQWEEQVVYPACLNRNLEPVITLLPVSIAHGTTTFEDLT